MTKSMRILIALPAMLLAVTAMASEEIYKWVDKDGNVHYGSRPKAKAAEYVDVDRPGFDAEPISEAEAAAAAARKAECDAKTAEYEKYKAADVIKQTDAFGETREFSKEEREKFVALAKSKMESACAEAPPPPPAAPAVDDDADAESGDDDDFDDDFDADFDDEPEEEFDEDSEDF